MSTNKFVWYELVTSDIDAAIAFYGPVLGWQAQDFPGAGDRYAIVSANGKGVGGVMKSPPGVSQPFWMGYISVPDIDAMISQFTGSGGAVHRAPWDVPGVGRLAVVADPQGAALAFIQGASDRPSEAFDQSLPGHGNWHELHTPDPESALAFYSARFGWTKGVSVDMGPMGTYRIFNDGDAQIGGMMKAREGMPPSWLYYFGVTSARDALARVTDAGGTVLHGPSEVPGGAYIVQAKDPQGAMFAMVGPA